MGDGTLPHGFWYVIVFWNDFTFSGKTLTSLTRWYIYFMGGSAAGGLWRLQQWSPSWVLSRIRNQVKIMRNGKFCAFHWLCMISATRFTFIVERSWKNMYFHPKLAWPPATDNAISRNHSNWLSLNLSQNLRKVWANSSWNWFNLYSDWFNLYKFSWEGSLLWSRPYHY